MHDLDAMPPAPTPEPEPPPEAIPQQDRWAAELARRRRHLTALDDEAIAVRYPPHERELYTRLRNRGGFCLWLDERAYAAVLAEAARAAARDRG